MKAFLISDNEETAIGLKISGIDGVVLHKKDEIALQLDELVKNKEIGIVIFTERAAALVTDKIDYIRLNCKLPLIIQIPDRYGQVKGKENMLGHIKESMGLKIRGDNSDRS